MARAMTTYSLEDLTASQAKEKGEFFFKVWKEFHLMRLKRRVARTKPPVK